MMIGQSRKREGTVEIIDRLFRAPVPATVDGHEAKIPALAAITYQLLHKDFAGNARAGRVLAAYEDLIDHPTSSGLELEFADNDYTRSLAKEPPEGNDD